jgi:hypothetical protein
MHWVFFKPSSEVAFDDPAQVHIIGMQDEFEQLDNMVPCTT